MILPSCQHKMSLSEIEEQERIKQDSILKKQKVLAQDSISKLNSNIFAGFFFGMSEKEYNKTKLDFENETNGCVEIDNLIFRLYNPEFDNGKLSCLSLGASDIVEVYHGYDVSTDYFSIMKERYNNRLGKPDLYLNDHLQECNASSKDLAYIAWLFDERVVKIGATQHLLSDGRLEKYYWISFYTSSEWIKTKKAFDKIVQDKKNRELNNKIKRQKYSNEL